MKVAEWLERGVLGMFSPMRSQGSWKGMEWGTGGRQLVRERHLWHLHAAVPSLSKYHFFHPQARPQPVTFSTCCLPVLERVSHRTGLS